MKKTGITAAIIFAWLGGFCQAVTQQFSDTITISGQKTYDLDNSGTSDFSFEILELSPGNYAARVFGLNGSDFLDNSTFGYPDALIAGDTIFHNGSFGTGPGVLGTFTGAGQFSGNGERYLGIRLAGSSDKHVGWISLICAPGNDTLFVTGFGYNAVPLEWFTAGQTIGSSIGYNLSETEVVTFYPNPTQDWLIFPEFSEEISTVLITGTDGRVSSETMHNGKLSLLNFSEGIYSVSLDQKLMVRVIVVR